MCCCGKAAGKLWVTTACCAHVFVYSMWFGFVIAVKGILHRVTWHHRHKDRNKVGAFAIDMKVRLFSFRCTCQLCYEDGWSSCAVSDSTTLAYPLSVCVCESGVAVDHHGGGGCVDAALRKPPSTGGSVAPSGGDVLPPKRQAVVARLRRRIESYRRRQNDCAPRFHQSFNGLCEQNIQDTLILKQRFLETKTKRAAKKTEKKQDATGLQTSLHTVSNRLSVIAA